MSALQRQLGDQAVRRKTEEEESHYINCPGDYPWSPEAWKNSNDAILNGTWKPWVPRRYVILLTPDGPISSASQLQKLAETESLPEAMVTSQLTLDGQEIGKVTICDVSMDEWDKITEKAHVAVGVASGVTVMYNGKGGYARIVKALKEGVTLEDENEEGSASGRPGQQ